MTDRMPALFLSHGSPTLPFDPLEAREFLSSLGRTLPRPRAVLCCTAHWETAGALLSGVAAPDTIHDFYGFPPELYRLRYPAPGSPEVASRAAALLADAGLPVGVDRDRGLDHGTWVPLMLMYPDADVPVVQLSVQPALDAAAHVAIGRALAPLREEGVLVIGSGAATHNLREFGRHALDASPAEWVLAFVAWLRQRVAAADVEALVHWRERAPHASRNHPTPEHLLPLFVALGAAAGAAGRTLHDEVAWGVLAMTCLGWE